MKLFQFKDGYYYDIDDMTLPKKGETNVVGVKEGAPCRNPQGEVCLRVFQVDSRGGQHYYLPDDICWLVEPTEDDAGVTSPIDGAIPRDKYGKAVEGAPEKVRITVYSDKMRIAGL